KDRPAPGQAFEFKAGGTTLSKTVGGVAKTRPLQATGPGHEHIQNRGGTGRYLPLKFCESSHSSAGWKHRPRVHAPEVALQQFHPDQGDGGSKAASGFTKAAPVIRTFLALADCWTGRTRRPPTLPRKGTMVHALTSAFTIPRSHSCHARSRHHSALPVS